MTIGVLGLWHLGSVTAACLASAGHDVIGVDFDSEVVAGLAEGRPPLFEPGLEDLVKSGLAAGRLRFTADAAAVESSDVVWVAFDTPVDDDDRADVDFVVDRVARVFPFLRDGALVLISSQVPAGTTRRLEAMFAAAGTGRRVTFAYSPENLRLGKAIAVFTQPDRVVVGIRSPEQKAPIEAMLRPFTTRFEWMGVESAEMTKHALNAFLATSVTFINEVAILCEEIGADASEVARGLKSEARIGPGAYLGPGAAFAGGTLARDVVFLSALGRSTGLATHLLSAVKASNDAHREWAQRRLARLDGGVAGKRIAVWGLTYKPGTDTLRRSSAIELCEWIHGQGGRVRAHDPAVRALPGELAARIELVQDPLASVEEASALVVATPWPEYREIAAAEVAARLRRPLVLDAARFLGETLGRSAELEYVSVGKASR
jgi:UDPglucose 6-dehydrogenase